MKDKVDDMLKQIYSKLDSINYIQQQMDLKTKELADIKNQSQIQITGIFNEIRKRIDIKERELITYTEELTDDMNRKISETSRNANNR